MFVRAVRVDESSESGHHAGGGEVEGGVLQADHDEPADVAGRVWPGGEDPRPGQAGHSERAAGQVAGLRPVRSTGAFVGAVHRVQRQIQGP